MISIRDSAITAFSTPRFNLAVIIILSCAFAIGGWLRFEHLGRLDITAGEAVSWLAAAQPNAREVLADAIRFNPGKLGAHDVAMHLWMRVFGDSLQSMRGLSAFCGLLAIGLSFIVTIELFASTADDPARDAWSYWIAATTALLIALNLPLIHHSREARMYSVLIAAILAQVWFFMRAYRVGGRWNYLALTAFSVLAIAAHFTAGSVMLAEALWLIPELINNMRHGGSTGRTIRIVKVGGAVAAAGVVLLPFLHTPLFLAERFVFRGKGFGWVQPPGLFAPVGFFVRGVTGTTNGPMSNPHAIGSAFIVIAIIAAWGAIRGVRHARGAVSFALLWMFVPTVLPQILSYLITPFFLQEYALSSYIPFSMLVALGVRELGGWLSYPALALVLGLAVGPIQRYRARTTPIQWQAACEFTAANLGPDQFAIVVPGWTVDAAHYYLRHNSNIRVQAAPRLMWPPSEPFPTLLIAENNRSDEPFGLQLLASGPELLRKFDGVSVYRLSPRIGDLLRNDGSSTAEPSKP